MRGFAFFTVFAVAAALGLSAAAGSDGTAHPNFAPQEQGARGGWNDRQESCPEARKPLRRRKNSEVGCPVTL